MNICQQPELSQVGPAHEGRVQINQEHGGMTKGPTWVRSSSDGLQPLSVGHRASPEPVTRVTDSVTLNPPSGSEKSDFPSSQGEINHCFSETCFLKLAPETPRSHKDGGSLQTTCV